MYDTELKHWHRLLTVVRSLLTSKEKVKQQSIILKSKNRVIEDGCAIFLLFTYVPFNQNGILCSLQ